MLRGAEARPAATPRPTGCGSTITGAGPMGYGMGTLQVVRHDGKGGLTVEPRPFVVMADNAMVDLGVGQGRKGEGGAGAVGRVLVNSTLPA